MQIYTMQGKKKALANLIVAILLFAITALVLMWILESYERNPRDGINAVGVIVATVALFAGFIYLGFASSIRNYAKLHVFVMDEAGELYHVFFTVKEGTPRPASVIGMIQTTIETERILTDVKAKEKYLKGEDLKDYLEGVWNGTLEKYQEPVIHHIGNPFMKSATEFYYTTEWDVPKRATIFKDCEGYDIIVKWLKEHDTKYNYKGKKVN